MQAIASDALPDREQAGPSYALSGPLPGTFLGPALDIRSESLYELAPDIPDVVGCGSCKSNVCPGQSVHPGCDSGRPRGVWLLREIARRYGRRGVAVCVTK